MVSFHIFLLASLPVRLASGLYWCNGTANVANPYPNPDTRSPDSFVVTLNTNVELESKTPIVIEVTREWSPLGADRFYSLVKDGFYNGAAFFRVVPDFVQFGIAADPDMTEKWNTTIIDDPVTASNTQWTVSFATAGSDTRTTQLFINLLDNSNSLDSAGFSPFGKVISGFETIEDIDNPTPGDDNGVDQGLYSSQGNDWLMEAYPNISMIQCGEITQTGVQQARDFTFMLVMSFVTLSIVIVLVGVIMFVRRSNTPKPLQDGSDGIRLMDSSWSSEVSTIEESRGM